MGRIFATGTKLENLAAAKRRWHGSQGTLAFTPYVLRRMIERFAPDHLSRP